MVGLLKNKKVLAEGKTHRGHSGFTVPRVLDRGHGFIRNQVYWLC